MKEEKHIIEEGLDTVTDGFKSGLDTVTNAVGSVLEWFVGADTKKDDDKEEVICHCEKKK